MHGIWANESDTPAPDMRYPACYDGTWEKHGENMWAARMGLTKSKGEFDFFDFFCFAEVFC